MHLINRLIPFSRWLRDYRSEDFVNDSVAGIVVLFITVPQSIAYAFLAGLPAEMGLYAAIFALIAYAGFGTSRSLAVGPTAIIAMMTLEATSRFAIQGSPEFVVVSMKLALLTGVILLLLRLINFGAVISFLSHAVVTGFITAAAILIITNQIPAILGLPTAESTEVWTVIPHVVFGITDSNLVVASIGVTSIAFLWLCKTNLEAVLRRWLPQLSDTWLNAIVKSAPMYAVILSICAVAGFSLDIAKDVPVVGVIPSALPTIGFVMMSLQDVELLAPSALLISMVVFMESTSIGTAMASKRREKIQPNQELIGLGVANVAASIGGGFPVAGSFARSAINNSSGAVTPIASLVTAILLIFSLIAFAGLFYYLPKAILAAVIIMSAIHLIDIKDIQRTFVFNRTDAVTFTFTFFAVLGLGVESGILVGIAISFVLLIRKSSKPHIAIVGRLPGTEHFRNVERHDVETYPHVLAVRIDESLYFVNVRYIETFLLNKIADSERLEHILLICTATNFIDASGLEMLETLSDNLQAVGVTLHLAEVKGPVMDSLKDTAFLHNMTGELFLSADLGMRKLANMRSGEMKN
ncbi:MAG: sulfate permease [Pseudomonadales bacterium]|nr:sulfate permease [Pseudomonadales bacterium]MDG1444057.1 sulfate permease [Pseudomonadales bacterium]